MKFSEYSNWAGRRQHVYNASMSLRLSRRRWVLLMGSAPLLAQTAAQTPAPALTPEQRVEKAKNNVRENSLKLEAIEVPMNVEPSFRFVA
jgi:hypothetical protein